MAKALFGHVGGPDTRLISEVAMLRRRVQDLEAEVLRLSAENDAHHRDPLLTVGVASAADEIISLDGDREAVSQGAPALA
jgi:hypothetical protein